MFLLGACSPLPTALSALKSFLTSVHPFRTRFEHPVPSSLPAARTFPTYAPPSPASLPASARAASLFMIGLQIDPAGRCIYSLSPSHRASSSPSGPSFPGRHPPSPPITNDDPQVWSPLAPIASGRQPHRPVSDPPLEPCTSFLNPSSLAAPSNGRSSVPTPHTPPCYPLGQPNSMLLCQTMLFV